ncbi:glycosyltransferase [Bifidobacterium choerinum]|uniref:Glycosyltransferase n=2 Tax=Bifidobacterium choerinum TaxID=35760 RepID=A0A087ADI0_9BIFI|nr:glycosyltransferase [Bifidobacterium choerinum]KFI56830.1 glycosyltransferase [Bifidobacterium choerinum]
MPPFTLLMAVYGGNSLREVERSVQSSTIEQILPPSQIVIVRDGAVPDPVQRYLDTLQSTMSVWFAAEHPDEPVPQVTIVPLEENRGLAHALNVGLRHCKYDIVARADSDDVSLPNRFATLIPLFVRRSNAAHTSARGRRPIDVMGSAIREFSDDEDEPGQIRMLPAEGPELERYARMQSPVHHPSVVFRKSTVLAAGGYPEDSGRFEDYMLWERLMLAHAQFLNVPQTLVLYRTNEAAYERRGGGEMFRDELRLQWRFLRDGFTTPWQFLRNVVIRAIYRVIPTSLRKRAYRSMTSRHNTEIAASPKPPKPPERGRHSAAPSRHAADGAQSEPPAPPTR